MDFVQVYVSKGRIVSVRGERTLSELTKATVFAAASSGWSFGAITTGKRLFKKRAHTANVFGFVFASTTLIVKVGLKFLILLGWAVLVAELSSPVSPEYCVGQSKLVQR